MFPACGMAAPGLAAPPFESDALAPIQLRQESQVISDRIPLFLATTLNQRDMGMQPAQAREGRVFMLRETLLAMGLRVKALDAATAGDVQQDWIALDAIGQVDAQFDPTLQTLVVRMPFEQLNWSRTRLDAAEFKPPEATASPGFLVNYDIYGFGTSQGRSVNGSTELRLFRANTVLSNTMLTRYSQSQQPAAAHNHLVRSNHFENVRLDSTVSHSFPDKMLTLRVGDAITATSSWSRATRIGGIQIARNFGLQPYRTTTPIPVLMGTSALPSDIELFINGTRQYRGNVPAGPFSLNATTGLVGAGNAQLVLTDALGRDTVLQYSFYGTQELLSKGLSDWSAELGWVRKNYGLSSFDYGSQPLASGTWKHGHSDRLTWQTHAEWSPHLLNLGAGMTWLLGKSAGVASAALAASEHHGNAGALAQLGYNWNNGKYFISLQGTHASNGFRDAAALHNDSILRSSARALAGVSSARWGSFNLGWVQMRKAAEAAQRYVTLGWSRPVGKRGFVSLGLHHHLDDHRMSNAQLMFTWYMDNRLNLSSTVSHRKEATRVSLHADRRAPSEGGWGFVTSVQSGSSGSNDAQARAEWRGSSLEASAAAARNGHTSSLGLGVTGSLIQMGGHLFASRRVDDGFAVVSTNGVAGVPIQRENITIGHTDEKGVMLVPRLGAYRANKISLNPMQLPAQTRIPQVDHVVAPTDRAGVFVDFQLQQIRSATVLLHDSLGAPLPIGTIVTLRRQDQAPGADSIDAPGMVGFDGSTYFEQLGDHNILRAYLPDASACEAEVHWPETHEDEVPVIGPVICLPRS